MTIATAIKTHKSLIGTTTTTTTTTIITTTMTPPLPHRVDIAKKRKGQKNKTQSKTQLLKETNPKTKSNKIKQKVKNIVVKTVN